MSRALAVAVPVLLALVLWAPPAHAAWFAAEPVDAGEVLAVGNADVARDGRGAVVYLKRDAGVPHVYLSRLVDGAWRPPERVDAGIADAATQARVAVADGNRLAVVWLAGGRAWGALAPEGGQPAALSAPAPLADGALGEGLALDMGVNGTAYALLPAQGGGGADLRGVRLQGTAWEAVAAPLDIDAARAAGTGTGRADVAVSAEGYAVAAWGEGGRVYGRRITGLALSLAPQDLTLGDLGGVPGQTADLPDVTIEYDGSFAWVAFRQAFAGAPRVLARRLVGSLFDPPAALDGGAASGEPRVALSGKGAGHGVSVTGAGTVLDSALKSDAFLPATRLDVAGGAADPVVGTSERTDLVTAWRDAAGLQGRYAFEGKAWGPPTPLSRPEAGPIGAGDVSLSIDRLGDTVIAARQGAALVAAVYDRPPGRPGLSNTSRYQRRNQPLLKWRPGAELWGQGFRVVIDGTPVGETAATQLALAQPLADGRHRWQVVAVDRRGQAIASKTGTLRIDATAPRLRVRVTGRRRAGAGLRVAVTTSDPRGSGLKSLSVSYGDGARTGRTRSVHRYRRGRFTLVVRATDRAGNVARAQVRLRIRR